MGLTIGLGPAVVKSVGPSEDSSSVLALFGLTIDSPNSVTGTVEFQFDDSLAEYFANNKRLRKVGLFDTSKVTSFKKMFYYCKSLIEVPSYDLSAATEITQMFDSCSILESVPAINVPNATSLLYLFNLCGSLKSADITAPNATSLWGTFWRCTQLKSVTLSLGDGITDMKYAFSNCSALETIAGVLDVLNVTTMSDAFTSCNALKSVQIKKLATSVSFSASSALSKDSVLYLFENAQTVESETITLHADVLAQLTDDEIAIATEKGFSVVSA